MTVDKHNRFRLYENGSLTITKRHSNVGNTYFPHCLNYNPDDYHKTRVKSGEKTKSYSITPQVYRKIASASVRMYKRRKYKIITITLTFPSNIDYKKANECFSKFIDNLEHNYHLNAHIAVRELTDKGVVHYHVLLDIPHFNVKKLNDAWCHTFSGYFSGSPNAVRLGGPKGTVVHSVGALVNYMCKYMGKCKDVYSERCYFNSENVTSRPKDLDYNDFQALLQEFKSRKYHYDYCIIVTFLYTTARGSCFWDWFTESYQNQVDFPLKTCFPSFQIA
ncbi:hypothetical protein ES705_40044 [subsurface metagenome]